MKSLIAGMIGLSCIAVAPLAASAQPSPQAEAAQDTHQNRMAAEGEHRRHTAIHHRRLAAEGAHRRRDEAEHHRRLVAEEARQRRDTAEHQRQAEAQQDRR
jgi:hypothetical protein